MCKMNHKTVGRSTSGKELYNLQWCIYSWQTVTYFYITSAWNWKHFLSYEAAWL
jgi:hypothetical protein